MSGRPVLVIGSTGFIGRALVARLRRDGTEVLALGPSESPGREPGVSRVRGSTEDRALVDELLANCGPVVYLASRTRPGLSATAPSLEIGGNLAPLAAFLELARTHTPRRLLFVSSAGAVYGDAARSAVEDSALRPRSYYGAGKAAAEAFIHAFSACAGWEAVILRPSNIFGPGQMGTKDFAVVPALLASAREGKAFPVWGDGLAVRDYCYVEDFASLVAEACVANLRTRSVVVNVASGTTASLLDLAALCEKISGRRIPMEFHPPRSVDVPWVSPSPEAAFQLLGWRAETSLEEGLARTWAWFQHAPR